MPCKQENDALLYAYGELEDAKTPAFLEHLKTCKECQNILHICALTTASLAPKQAPEFCVPTHVAEVKTSGFKFGFLKGMHGLRWVYPATVFTAFALILGFTAFEFTAKKPMVKVQTNTVTFFEQADNNLTDLETEFDDLFAYMQEF